MFNGERLRHALFDAEQPKPGVASHSSFGRNIEYLSSIGYAKAERRVRRRRT